jgi:hypothetical protein
MRVNARILAMIMALGGTTACGTNYSKEIQTAIKDAFKQDFKNYTFRGTPVGTFGVGTMYLKELGEPDNVAVDDRYLVGHPGSWFAAGVDTTEAKAWNARIIVPGSMGSVQMKKTVSTKLGLEAVVPAIQQVVAAGLDVSYERGVNVTLTAKNASHHKINISEFATAVDSGKINAAVKQRWEARDFLLTAADITLTGYRANVVIDEKVNPALHAKFTGLAGTSTEAGAVKISVQRTATGAFEVIAQEDVVAALLVKEPPSADQFAEDDVDNWPTVNVDQRLLAIVDSIAARRTN